MYRLFFLASGALCLVMGARLGTTGILVSSRGVAQRALLALDPLVTMGAWTTRR